MTKGFLLFTCLCLHFASEAQYSRYIIRFSDKKGSPYTLSDPAAYLSPKAHARRSKQNIAIDSTDLPLSPAYLGSLLSVPGVTILNRSKWLNQVCIRTADAAALAAIRAFPFVQSASPVGARIGQSLLPVSKTLLVPPGAGPGPDHARIAAVNALNYGSSFGQVHIHHGEYLHNLGFTGAGVRIAVNDAGFFRYNTNPAFDSVRLQNRILGEWDFVANEQSVNEDDVHGMYCFSLLASNRPGMLVGTAPAAGYYLFRTEDAASEYPVEEQNWAAAAELADSLGADMISSSLGYADFDDHSFDHAYAQRNGNTAIITLAADLAAKKGMIVMNSAGNSGTESTDLKYIACPADGDSVVAVGAVDIQGNIAAFSSGGPNGAGKLKPNIVSVGVAPAVADLNGNPTNSAGNGTSFSNPNVAGLVACLWQAFPEASNMAVIDAVQRSADRYTRPDNRYGYGIPDFKKAFAILVSKAFTLSVTNDQCVNTITWTGKDNQLMRYALERKAPFDTGYIKIADIAGRSAGFAPNSYQFKDSVPYASSTEVFYRIKQTLPEDTAILLGGMPVTVGNPCNTGNRFSVGPNPVGNSLSVNLFFDEAVPKMSIVLYNLKGQKLYRYEGAKSNGIFSLTIPTAGLPAGAYILTVRDNRHILFSKKLVKGN